MMDAKSRAKEYRDKADALDRRADDARESQVREMYADAAAEYRRLAENVLKRAARSGENPPLVPEDRPPGDMQEKPKERSERDEEIEALKNAELSDDPLPSDSEPDDASEDLQSDGGALDDATDEPASDTDRKA